MNVQSHVVRETRDIHAGARFGAAPWQVGVLAASLLVFEIFVGAHPPAALEGRASQVTPEHLQWAYALLQLAPWQRSFQYFLILCSPCCSSHPLAYCHRPGAASEANCPWRCSSYVTQTNRRCRKKRAPCESPTCPRRLCFDPINLAQVFQRCAMTKKVTRLQRSRRRNMCPNCQHQRTTHHRSQNPLKPRSF